MLGLAVRPSAFLRGTIACTGIEFCKLALVETKGRAETIRQELEKRLPDFDTPITINVNGCPNSCARFQVADIGFKGMVAKGADGDEDAFQVHLGGLLGENAEFGRKFRGLQGDRGRGARLRRAGLARLSRASRGRTRRSRPTSRAPRRPGCYERAPTVASPILRPVA